MLERFIVTFVVIGGLGLLWFGWQHYKAKMLQTIQPVETPTGRPTLLYFTAEYCKSCRLQQTPIVEEIVKRLGNSVTVKRYDVVAHPDLASHYKVLTLPTIIVLDEQGQVKHLNFGVTGQAKLQAQLSRLYSAKLDEFQYAP